MDIVEPVDQKKIDLALRKKVKGLFSAIPEVRLDAIDALKQSWCYDEPSFEVTELASHPAQNCAIMAARRDAHKEVITWLTKL
jgi:hypothetical protein